MNLNKISKQIKNKRVLVRVDFNVAMKGNKVIEDYKISRSLPTIKQLLKQGNKVIIISHLGRPDGKWVNYLSLEPVVKLFRKLIKQTVTFKKEKLDKKLVEAVNKSKANLIVLENMRFYPGEKANDKKFSELLSSLADVYINENFASSHRDYASVTGVAKLLPSYAGLNLIEEVKFLEKALKPKKPAIAFIGGAKIKNKFGVLENFLKKYNKVMVGGGIANTILAATGHVIGSSIVDLEFITKAKKLPKNKIILPVDFVIAKKNDHSKIRYHKTSWGTELCEKDEMILDVGIESLGLFSKEIAKAKTIVWGGPFGLMGEKPFDKGSVALAKMIANSKATSIVGGGETTASVNMARVGKKITFISTGGGSMLSFLEGKTLPGLKALEK